MGPPPPPQGLIMESLDRTLLLWYLNYKFFLALWKSEEKLLPCKKKFKVEKVSTQGYLLAIIIDTFTSILAIVLSKSCHS